MRVPEIKVAILIISATWFLGCTASATNSLPQYSIEIKGPIETYTELGDFPVGAQIKFSELQEAGNSGLLQTIAGVAKLLSFQYSSDLMMLTDKAPTLEALEDAANPNVNYLKNSYTELCWDSDDVEYKNYSNHQIPHDVGIPKSYSVFRFKTSTAGTKELKLYALTLESSGLVKRVWSITSSKLVKTIPLNYPAQNTVYRPVMMLNKNYSDTLMILDEQEFDKFGSKKLAENMYQGTNKSEIVELVDFGVFSPEEILHFIPDDVQLRYEKIEDSKSGQSVEKNEYAELKALYETGVLSEDEYKKLLNELGEKQ